VNYDVCVVACVLYGAKRYLAWSKRDGFEWVDDRKLAHEFPTSTWAREAIRRVGVGEVEHRYPELAAACEKIRRAGLPGQRRA